MVTKVFPGATIVPRQEWCLDKVIWAKGKQLLIYISAPYSLGDVVTNVRFACEVGDKILTKGHIPFVPHLTHFWHFISPKSWEEWMKIDTAIVKRCDALLRVNGKSIGADMEVTVALDAGIPVYYSLEEIPNV